MNRRIIPIILVLTMLFGAPVSVVNATNQAEKNTYSMANVDDYFAVFSNYVDGYKLYVEKDMSVDMSYSSICASLENSNKRIEIYRQRTVTTSKNTYINYSNKFLENTVDHIIDYDGWMQQNGKSIKVTAWHRNQLSRVKNDKNYYMTIDYPQGASVYTIFIKSALPISENGGYEYLINSFETFTPTANSYTRVAQEVDIEKRGWNAETAEFYVNYFSEESDLTWGIFEPQTASYDYYQIDFYEKYFNYHFPIWLNYTDLENTYRHRDLDRRLQEAYSHGAVLELTLQTSPSDNGNLVYDILEGKYDSFLNSYAMSIADFGHPVMFRLFNEMNGDWCPYSSYNTSKDTLIYKEVYKYVYKIFENQGANTNTIWIWNPNSVSFPNFNWNHSLMYYPGDKYVDVIGLTAYNTGNYYKGESWQSFNSLYDTVYYDYCRWFNKPFMITEFSSASCGGDKAEWINNMFNHIENYDRIKVAIWWDGCDYDAYGNVARAYFLDENESVLKAFRKGLMKYWNLGIYA